MQRILKTIWHHVSLPKMDPSISGKLKKRPVNELLENGIFSVNNFETAEIFINGDLRTVTAEYFDRPLSDFLRSEGLTSVKIGCGEGECGACSVLMQYLDDNNQIVTKSVNSCLIPIVLMEGKHVVTMEGLNHLEGMKVVQDTFLENNATQCGFCTPGFEMNLYNYLSQCEVGGEKEGIFEEIEDVLSGNICRCTGYRSIYDAAKESYELFPSQENELAKIFPQELRGEEMDEEKRFVKYFESNDGESEWFVPNTIEQLLLIKDELLEKGRSCKMVNGATEVMVKKMKGKEEANAFLVTDKIKDFKRLEINNKNNSLIIGSSVTIDELEEFCLKNSNKNGIFKMLYKQIKKFASNNVRNIASIGGNVCNASPNSDFNPIFAAMESKFHILGKGERRRVVVGTEFFMGYKKVDVDAREVLECIEVPFLRKNEVVEVFKQSKRRKLDWAIVNSCIKMEFNKDKSIKDCKFVFGNVDQTVIEVPKLQKFWRDKEFSETNYLRGLEILDDEINLERNRRKMKDYKENLVLSFYYKFYRKIQEEIYGKRCETFGELDRPISEGKQFFRVKIFPNEEEKLVGKPITRLYSETQMQGTCQFVDDIPKVGNKECGELQVFMVLTDISKGELIEIDESQVLKMKGVKFWIDHRNVTGKNNFGFEADGMDEEIFVSKEIQSIGQIIGCVLADTYENAKRAAEKLRLTIRDESKDSIYTITKAIENESFHEQRKPYFEKGNLKEGFENSAKFIEGEIRTGGQDHLYMETQRCLVVPTNNDEYEVYSSCQSVVDIQYQIARVLGIPSSKINSRARRVGGCFGGKIRSPFVASIAAICSHVSKHPCRLVMSREEDMIITGGRHPFYCKYKAGINEEGLVDTLDLEFYIDGGYCSDLSPCVIHRSMMMHDNCYNVKNLRINGRACKTNKPTNTAMRGFGVPQTLFLMENIMNEIGKKLKVEDIDEFRKNHFYEKDDDTFYGQQITDANEIERSWEKIKKVSNYEERKKKVKEFNEKHKLRKRGIYIIPIKFATSFTNMKANKSSALVHVFEDGSVLVSHGGVEIGQGCHTKVSLIAQSILGCDIKQVHVTETSTSQSGYSGTAGAIGSDVNGAAVKKACEKIMKKLEPFLKKRPDYSWEEIVECAGKERTQLSAYALYKIPKIEEVGWNNNRGDAYHYYVYGASCGEVEIDCLTGNVQVLRLDLISDCGNSLNPKIDIGQIEGGVIQALGWLLMEERIWADGEFAEWTPSTGRLISGFPMVPTINDVPIEMNVHIDDEINGDFAVYGSKAIGESSFCLSSSVYFAIKEAIIESRKENGLDELEDLFGERVLYNTPLTPDKIQVLCGIDYENIVR